MRKVIIFAIKLNHLVIEILSWLRKEKRFNYSPAAIVIDFLIPITETIKLDDEYTNLQYSNKKNIFISILLYDAR